MTFYNRDIDQKLANAVKHDDAQSVSGCIIIGANINALADNGSSGLHNALMVGDTELAAKFLKYGADINVLSREKINGLHSIMQFGVFAQREKSIRFMVDHGIALDQKDSKGCTALQTAEKYEYHNIAAILKQAYADRARQAEDKRINDIIHVMTKGAPKTASSLRLKPKG